MSTVLDILISLKSKRSNPKAFNDQIDMNWVSLSTSDFLQGVESLSLALIAKGVREGDRIGIYASPSTIWTTIDMATLSIGCVAVPLFTNLSEDNFLYQVNETGMEVIFIEGDEPIEMIKKHEKLFKKVIVVGKSDLSLMENSNTITFSDFIKIGKACEDQFLSLYNNLKRSVLPDTLAAIIYTSGSTGIPKGVQLSHNNLTSVLASIAFTWDDLKDRYLSVLPLAHVFGHCINLFVMSRGASVYYSNDYKNLKAVCNEVKPTAIVVVPRLLEKIYTKMNDQIHTASSIKAFVIQWAFDIAKSSNNSFFYKVGRSIANILVYKKLREAFGGEIRFMISGGAPLQKKLQYFFDNVGIPVFEGWGMTEACPVCVNVPEHKKIGTVGLPLDQQKIMIDKTGEILVKGSLVTSGYYKKKELTALTIDREGWLHTGDRGFIDEEGFLIISGRIKELYKTSTGEYVAPVPLEEALGQYPLIEMSLIVAEGKKFTSCLLFVNLETLKRMKIKQKVENISHEEFLKSPYIISEMNKLLLEVNRHVNHWEQVHAYRFILNPLTVQGGDLTPSMKIKREVVLKKYASLIDEMYTHHYIAPKTS